MPARIVYHGTNTQFDAFDSSYSGTAGLDGAEYGEAYFFTDSQTVAEDYARSVAERNGGEPVVMTARVTLLNPLVFDFETDSRDHLNIEAGSRDDDILVQEELMQIARQTGNDGLITMNFDDGGEERITQYVAFSPDQIEITRCEPLVRGRNSAGQLLR